MPPTTTPISINPYQSSVPTVQVPPPDFSQAAPAQPLQGQFRGHGSGVMAIGDSILKGFIQGHEHKAQKKAAEAQATLSAADAAKNAAYQKYQDALATASGNVNDPTAKAAYGAYQDVFNKSKEATAKFVIPQDEPKKPKGAKDKIKGVFSNVKEFMAANPHLVPQLALLSMQPQPEGLSPDGKKQQAEQQRVSNEAKLGDIDLQEAQRKQGAQKVVDQYSGLTEEQRAALPASEQEKYRSAQNVLRPATSSGPYKEYLLADGKTKQWFHPDNAPEGAQPVDTAGAGGASKIGTFPDYASRWARENGLDPTKLTTAQIDALKKRYAWDTQHDSSTSTTVHPGIDSTTTTSSRSAGGPPPFPTVGGGPITRPPASSAAGTRRAAGGAITRPPAAGANGQVSPTRARMTLQATHEKEAKISQAQQKLADTKIRNERIADPTLRKQADDTAQKAFDDELKGAEHAYDQATIAMGGTPGGEKKKPASAAPPKGATVAYKDKNGVVQGYAVNGVYVSVSQ